MSTYTISKLVSTILAISYIMPKSVNCFIRPNIMRCPSYPNLNNIYNYSYSFNNIDNVIYANYKNIINDKKKRNIYLRLRENMVNRNIYF